MPGSARHVGPHRTDTAALALPFWLCPCQGLPAVILGFENVAVQSSCSLDPRRIQIRASIVTTLVSFSSMDGSSSSANLMIWRAVPSPLTSLLAEVAHLRFKHKPSCHRQVRLLREIGAQGTAWAPTLSKHACCHASPVRSF